MVSYESSDQIKLGERLLQQNSQDVEVIAHLALDYTTPGSEPYNLQDKNRVIQLSKELIRANPKYPSYYAVLAEAYYMSYYENGRHREDAIATITALKKYLSLAKPDESFYEVAKTRVTDLEKKLNINE